MWRYFKHLKIHSPGYIWCYFLGTNPLKFKCGFISADAVTLVSEVKSEAVHELLSHFSLGRLNREKTQRKTFLWIKNMLKNYKPWNTAFVEFCGVFHIFWFSEWHALDLSFLEHSASTYFPRLVKAWNYRCSLGWLLLSEHFPDL